MIDASIYNDENVLVGGGDSLYYASTKLRLIDANRPPWREPPKEGFKLLKEWASSPEGLKWNSEWDYLASLRIDDYIWLYSKFPSPFLSSVRKGSKKSLSRERIQNYYKGTATWLLWLAHKDRAKPLVLETQAYAKMELSAQIASLRLAVCQQIIDSPEFHLGWLFNRNPACLWFWVEVANCKYSLKSKGLFSAISPNNILSKREIHVREGKQLNVLENIDLSTEKDYIQIHGLSAILEKLPGIIETVSATIAAKNVDYRDAYHTPYVNLRHSERNRCKTDDSVQISYVYLDASGEEQMFVTGEKKKLPKCKGL